MIKRFLFIIIIFVYLFFCKNDPTGPIANFQATQLVYEINGQLYIITDDGSYKRKLCFGWGAKWSTDKNKIAFYSPNSELCIIGTDGSDRTILTNALPDSGGTLMLSLSWSPDASRILFCSSKKVPWSLHLINVDGTNEKRVVTEEGGFVSPQWSPGGNKISYEGWTSLSPKVGIYIANPEGTDKYRLINDGSIAMYGWHPNGHLIAFTGDFDGDSLQFNSSDVFICSSEGSNLIKLTNDGKSLFCDFSPAGDKIIFQTRLTPENKYLGIMDSDGTNQRILKKFGAEEEMGWAKYSADGLKIAYVMNHRRGNPYSELRVMNFDGSNDRKLDESDVPHTIFFDWSPL